MRAGEEVRVVREGVGVEKVTDFSFVTRSGIAFSVSDQRRAVNSPSSASALN